VPVSDIAGLTDANGQFRRGRLEAGSYTVEVHATGLPSRVTPIELAEGQQINVEIRLGEAEPVEDPNSGENPNPGSEPEEPHPASDPNGGTESNGTLAVELKTDQIDWSQVSLVRVALDYPGSGRGDATGRDYLLTPSNHEVIPWEIPLSDTSAGTYTYEIEYFMADGIRRSVQATDVSERTLVIDPSQ
jgi:hypothetical protein